MCSLAFISTDFRKPRSLVLLRHSWIGFYREENSNASPPCAVMNVVSEFPRGRQITARMMWLVLTVAVVQPPSLVTSMPCWSLAPAAVPRKQHRLQGRHRFVIVSLVDKWYCVRIVFLQLGARRAVQFALSIDCYEARPHSVTHSPSSKR